MNEFSKKEQLSAITLLGAARQLVADAYVQVNGYAEPFDEEVAVTAVLGLALDMSRNGADYSVVSTLEYPEVNNDVP